MTYWFTVDAEHPEVLDVGIRNGIWGVDEDARDRLDPLEPGDLLLFFHRDQGFVLCEVESEPYTEKVPVWPDADLPHRVRISDPVETDRYVNLGEVHECLLDPETGEPYSSVANARTALEGDGGKIRPLSDEEVRCLFRRLGWTLPPGVEPLPEEEEPEAEDEPPEAASDEEAAPEPEEEPEEVAPAPEEEEAVEAEEEELAEVEAASEEEAAAVEEGEDEVGEDREPPEVEAEPVREEVSPAEPAEERGPARAEPVAAEPADEEAEAEPAPAAAEPVAAGEEAGEPEDREEAPEAEPDEEGTEETEEEEEARAAEAPPDEEAVGEEPPPADEAEEPSLPRVILAPAAGNTASRHRYDDTVSAGVALERLASFLPDREMERLRAACPGDETRVWGTAPALDEGNRSQWEGSSAGDVMLFTGGGEVFASARVLLTRRDADLAEELWGRRDDGNTWEYLFFVGEPVEQAVTYEELNDVAGYEPAYRVPRLNVLERDRSVRVLAEFPELVPATEAGEEAPAETAPEEPGAGAGAEEEPGAAEGGAAPRGPAEAAPQEAAVEAEAAPAMTEARLRALFFGRRELGRCALCGRLMPVSLVAVVYVKPLEACSPDELEDVGNNVMPACRLGCAGLFRQGYVVVEDGVVQPGRSEPLTDPVKAGVEAVVGNRCEYWHAGSEPYFRWHAREHRGT